jgi:membrane protein implicated in regulation of membrane protease activity
MGENEEPESAKVENVAHVVGIQGSVVHNSNVYVVHPDAAPEQKYAVGVRYLDDGVPADARRLISDAIAHGYDNGEVRFHWMLAMLSKRSLRDLTVQELHQLELASSRLDRYPDDRWRQALATLFSLLDQLREGDCSVALKQLRELPLSQRDKVLRHLDLVLTGASKESLWAETREMAERLRFSDDRLNRVWAYFEPDPAGARARLPVDDRTTRGDRVRSTAWSMLAALAFGYLSWIAVRQTALMAIACFVVGVAVYVGVRNWMEWTYRSERFAAKERVFIGRTGDESTDDPGFAKRISRDFEHYFSTYLPPGVERDRWRAITSGVRRVLRDEVAEIYRESKVKADEVTWLVRYLASDVRTRWTRGTLFEHRTVYRVSAATKTWCVAAFAFGGAALSWLGVTAVGSDPWLSTLAFLVVILTGRVAVLSWYRIISETRRAAEDHDEYERRLDERRVAFERWKNKIDSTRPAEGEMESWLTFDRIVLLDKALLHYGLVWRDIITHAFLMSPAKSYKRARVKYGPWRYSKYDVRLFLITHDGVREVTTELDFEHGRLGDQERTNFRFDAVSSVHVVQSGASDCKLELTLFNGPTRDIRVVDADRRGAESRDSVDNGASDEKPSETSLDSAGFAHTLHILEGIAAEGKNWIKAASRNA